MFGKNRFLVIGRFTSIMLFLFLLPLLASSSFSADSTSFDPTKVVVTAKGSSGIPVGTIISWPVAQNPADFQNTDGSYNWLECNGQSFNATVYPELSALIGPTVPDLRGLFLRGQGGNSAALGITQGDAIRNITGWFGNPMTYPWGGSGSGAFFRSGSTGATSGSTGSAVAVGFGFDASRVVPTGNENRPVNVVVRYLIRSKT